MGPRMNLMGLARMLAGRNRETSFGGCQCFVRARYAQFHALARMGVGPEQGVLIPAYHCRTMIEPVIRAGAEPLLFRVDTALRADIEHLEALLRRRPDVRCMLLPHFFGFAQPASELEPVLERHGVTLIEDCAHVMAPATTPDGPGRRGKFSIFCPAKFLPCPDGGVLRENAGAPGTEHPLVRRRRRNGAAHSPTHAGTGTAVPRNAGGCAGANAKAGTEPP
ncbi:MAG: DegT/DnrJ/EryC1/StrS family aminotransferase [Halofilum sp. (in: g-proteobacteria)]|nr:DegT/DnrJ/EryC1/StrS family aminotransferase [Halofilum sp. (in: g-proteobacteria)]